MKMINPVRNFLSWVSSSVHGLFSVFLSLLAVVAAITSTGQAAAQKKTTVGVILPKANKPALTGLGKSTGQPASQPSDAAKSSTKPKSGKAGFASSFWQGGAGPVALTSIEGITEYRLANGLKVLLFPDNSKPTTTVNITYQVGSRNENYGETGMAHLLEHLMFKGSPKHPNVPGEFSTYGAQWNGSTWLDRTNYFETFPSSEKNIAWAIDLEAERMIHSYIAQKDLNSEMTVVRNEFESGENSPTRILSERMQSTAFLWHNYGHSTIGARADIEHVPIDRLQAFYHMYYQPDNAYLIVAGKFEPNQVLGLIEKSFGIIEKPTRVLQATYTAEPTQDGERSVVLRRTGDLQAVGSMYHIPNGFHPDYGAITILMDILVDEPSGRLYKNLVESKKATNIEGYPLALKEPGMAQFIASVLKAKNLDSAKSVLLSTVEAFATIPPTKEEVDRMKTKELKNIELALNSSDQIGISLSEFISMGDWRLFFFSRDELKKVSPADVMRVAKAYFKPANRTLGEFYPTPSPDRSEIPAPPVLATVLQGFKGGSNAAAGENFDPSPKNIDNRTQLETINGLKMALLSKKTRGQSVQIRMQFHYGNPASTSGKSVVGTFTTSMLNKGTKDKTRQQIEDAFDQLKAQVRIRGGAADLNVDIETVHDKLPGVLNLVAELLKTPSFPGDELEKLRLETIARLEKGRTDPQAIAIRLLNAKTSPYPADNYRHTPTLDEELASVKQVTLADIKSYYTTVMGGSNGEMAIVGDFSVDSTKNQLTKAFADWKSPGVYVRTPSQVFTITPVNEKVETPDKANGIFFATIRFPLSDADPDFAALKLAAYIYGEAQLSNRLANRIRQKEGLSYGVGALLQASDHERVASMFTYAIYAPQNLIKLEQAFKEETEKAIERGFTSAEVEDAKKGFRNNLLVELATDNQLAGTLANNLAVHRTMDYTAQLMAQVEALRPEEVNQAFKKYIRYDQISKVKAGDFAKKASEVPPAK